MHSKNSNVLELISHNVITSVVKNIYGQIAEQAQSSIESDVLQYIKTVGPIFKILNATGVLKKEDLIESLERIIVDSASFELRKEAVFEMVLNIDDVETHLNLPIADRRVILKEIEKWYHSKDVRKRTFAAKLDKKLSFAIARGDVNKLKVLTDFWGINRKNVSGISILQLAIYYRQHGFIDWLTSNSKFNFNAKNALGFSEVEQLRLSGREELADAIERVRPEAKGRHFQVRERNFHENTEDYPMGTPIIDFVKIEPRVIYDGK